MARRPKSSDAVNVGRELRTGEDLVYATDQWTRFLVAREADRDSLFSAALAPLVDTEGLGFGRELFSALYGWSEQLPAGDETSWAAEVMNAAKESDAWEGMADRAASDSWASSLAAANLLEQLSPKVLELLARKKEQEEAAKEKAKKEGLSPEEAVALMAAAQLVELTSSDIASIQGAVASVAGNVNAEIDELNGTLQAFAGSEAGVENVLGMPKDEVVERLARSHQLTEVLRIAGRMRIVSDRLRRTTDDPGREDTVGVETGDDLGLVLPHELALAAQDSTRGLFYRRYLDRELVQRQMVDVEREQGPIVVVIDESGSMSGAPICWAKALMAALLSTCIKERRAFGVVRFSDGFRSSVYADPASLSFSALEGLITGFLNGGTNTSAALNEAGKVAAKVHDKADVILITDGLDSWDMKRVEEINSKNRIHGIAIGCTFTEEQKAVMHYSTQLDPRSLDENSVDAVLSL